MLVVPFGRRRLLGVVVDVAAESELPPERLAEPIAALEADVPQSLVALGLWVAREYVSTPARGLALVLPPGTGTGAGRPLRPKRSLRAAITPAGEAALRDGVRMGAKQRAALEELAGAPLGAARPGAAHGLHALDAAQPRAARPDPARERRGGAAPHARACRGSAGAERVAHGGPGGGVRHDRISSGHQPSALPPSWSDGQRQDRGVPALGGGGARARAVGDRARPRDRPDAADGRAVRRALRRSGGRDALAAVAARALRRVVADAARRGARAALARARRYSPRSTTSG